MFRDRRAASEQPIPILRKRYFKQKILFHGLQSYFEHYTNGKKNPRNRCIDYRAGIAIPKLPNTFLC